MASNTMKRLKCCDEIKDGSTRLDGSTSGSQHLLELNAGTLSSPDDDDELDFEDCNEAHSSSSSPKKRKVSVPTRNLDTENMRTPKSLRPNLARKPEKSAAFASPRLPHSRLGDLPLSAKLKATQSETSPSIEISTPAPESSKVHADIYSDAYAPGSTNARTMSMKNEEGEDKNHTASKAKVLTATENVPPKFPKGKVARQSGTIVDHTSTFGKAPPTKTSLKASARKAIQKSLQSRLKAPPKSKSPALRRRSGRASAETLQAGPTAKHKDSRKKREVEESKDAANKEETKSQVDSTNKEIRNAKRTSFQDDLLHHLATSGKPHTIKALAQDLKMSEASVDDLLISLVEKGLVVTKEFKCSKTRSRELYWANQASEDKRISNNLAVAPPPEVAEAVAASTNLQQEEKSILMRLHQVLQEPSNATLNAHVTAAFEEIIVLQEQLNGELLKRIRVTEPLFQEPSIEKLNVGMAKAEKKVAGIECKLEWEEMKSVAQELKVAIHQAREELADIRDILRDQKEEATMSRQMEATPPPDATARFQAAECTIM